MASSLELMHIDSRTERNSIDEDDFDDDLDIQDGIKIVDVGNGPIAIESSDDELNDDKNCGIPFTDIYKAFDKFTHYNRDIFIPGESVEASIVDFERHVTTHILNPNLYTICLNHGDFTWKIKKRYKQFQSLHQQLLLFRTSLNIPLPSRTHKNKRKSFRALSPKGKKKTKTSLPRFPKKPEVIISYDKLEARAKQLETYLNCLLSFKIYRNHPATLEFLEISDLSFINGLGVKRKEGMIKKKSGSTQPGQSGCNCLGLFRCFCCVWCKHLINDMICTRWIERWFFIKDTCFGYVNPKTGQVKCVVLYDQGFEVASGMYAIGLQTGFQILTHTRQIAFKCWTRRKGKEWMEALKEVASTTARDFTQINRHRSFAPTRNQTTASWFVDAATYMSSVADAIANAREEIFITDWWLSPEIYLKRPIVSGHEWRLDTLLKRKAAEGVKISILLYKEFEMALGLNSFYSKQRLAEAHPNIKVLRHPNHAKVGVFLWAHHEKMVVVDQNYAFVGGIDLCYGRWDDHTHRLTDLGSITPSVDLNTCLKKTSSGPEGAPIYPIPTPVFSQCPIPIVTTTSPDGSEEELSIPQLQPGDHLFAVQTPEKIKCNTPEPDRKNMIQVFKKSGKNLIKLAYNSDENEDEIDECQKDEFISYESPEQLAAMLHGSSKLWIGKDYVNFIVQDFNNLDSPFDDFIDRATTPRMPWHDIGVGVQGASAKDVARHFIQRWNATKLAKAKNNDNYPYLLPKSYAEFKTLPLKFPNGTHQVTCQVLRSASTWSCGFLEPDTVEQSIHEAYIEAISKAQHYIYIENQFFISLAYKNGNTRNQISDVLYKRILRAHKANEKFRVYVVMPLLPAFEGEVGGPTGTALHAITHWNYASISRGKDAILTRLKEAGIEDPSNYISFFGLRNHSKLNNEPITELIYVHSKLMIVDDKIVICGSANINDRSLLGKRDSEIAVLIEDECFVDGIMNGQNFPCGKFAGSLRKYLFKEHLGLLNKTNETTFDVTDPISDLFYKNVWQQTASLNTELYEKVFHCLPSDEVTTFADLKKYKLEKPFYTYDVNRAEKMLDTLQGHLVLLPLNFLKDELLTPAVNSMEGIMPTSLWT